MGAPKESHRGEGSGAHVRPWSENQAEQYWGLAGRWESLPFPWDHYQNGRDWFTNVHIRSGSRARSGTENARQPKVSYDEEDRVTEMNEGSLSLCIVALEKRGTRPEDPWSSQGGGQIMEAWSGNYAWTTET